LPPLNVTVRLESSCASPAATALRHMDMDNTMTGMIRLVKRKMFILICNLNIVYNRISTA
jgi:hypothetical protein